MQSQSRLLDDLARVASGAVGVAGGVRGEVEARLREQFERVVAQMDLVTREDHEVALAMAQRAREAQEDLAEQVARLEARVNELEKAGNAPSSRRRKTASAAKGKAAGRRGKSGSRGGGESGAATTGSAGSTSG